MKLSARAHFSFTQPSEIAELYIAVRQFVFVKSRTASKAAQSHFVLTTLLRRIHA